VLQKQTGAAGTLVAAVAESAQRGSEALIETQKEFLDEASKPPKAAKDEVRDKIDKGADNAKDATDKVAEKSKDVAHKAGEKIQELVTK
jgi:ElaB/YqjD/DUF883 family membrane-anchored ribosome-binding protein